MKSQEFLQEKVKGPVQAVSCGTLIDGRGGNPVKDAVVLVQGNRITKVGVKGKLKPPPGAEPVDCSRYTVMPGMMDLHIHTAMHNCMTFHNHRVAQFETMPHLQQMYALFHAQNCFDMGFTTLRDLGMNGPYGLLVNEMCAVRDAINAGIVEGPRMLIAGFTTMTGSHLELIQPRAMYRWGFNLPCSPTRVMRLPWISTTASFTGLPPRPSISVPQLTARSGPFTFVSRNSCDFKCHLLLSWRRSADPKPAAALTNRA